jgi:carbon monoxide dehydrogenase subunit G
MTKIESKIGQIKQSDEKIFNFLSDFNNFQRLIPLDKVKNWKSTTDSCSFTVDGIGDAGMRIIEKIPYSLIKVTSEGSTPIGFLFWIQLKKIDDTTTAVKIVIEPKVNPIMMTMIKEPLQSFVNMLVEQVEKININ